MLSTPSQKLESLGCKAGGSDGTESSGLCGCLNHKPQYCAATPKQCTGDPTTAAALYIGGPHHSKLALQATEARHPSTQCLAVPQVLDPALLLAPRCCRPLLCCTNQQYSTAGHLGDSCMLEHHHPPKTLEPAGRCVAAPTPVQHCSPPAGPLRQERCSHPPTNSGTADMHGSAASHATRHRPTQPPHPAP